jgi:ATP-binding cassette subfamily B protein
VDVRDASLRLAARLHRCGHPGAHLFHETIAENLRYARPEATDDELWQALERAQVGPLSDLPDGLDTVVGSAGYRFSGGEKQRIAIARLLLKAPSIVILDEATAHLDSESEAAVQRALAEALQGRTALVIAHRLSTVRDADQIVVLDGGRSWSGAPTRAGRRRRPLRRAVPDPVRGGRLAAVLCGRRGPTRARSTAER